MAHAGDVPDTLPQAFAALDQQLSPHQRDTFRNSPEASAVARAHMSMGRHIRNVWFRSGHSELPARLHELGAQSLDDMSSVVLTSYWRHLNGKPLRVEEQCACYARWWQEQSRLESVAKARGEEAYSFPDFDCPRG